jgi:hypothetical protein
MKKLFTTILFITLVQVSFSQEKASREDVLKVIEKSGAFGQINAAKKQVLGMIPKEKQAAFIVEFDVLIKKVNENTVDVYLQEYTKEDIKAMLDFYDSPVGIKMTQKAEVIASKSQAVIADLQAEMQAMLMKYMQ